MLTSVGFLVSAVVRFCFSLRGQKDLLANEKAMGFHLASFITLVFSIAIYNFFYASLSSSDYDNAFAYQMLSGVICVMLLTVSEGILVCIFYTYSKSVKYTDI